LVQITQWQSYQDRYLYRKGWSMSIWKGLRKNNWTTLNLRLPNYLQMCGSAQLMGSELPVQYRRCTQVSESNIYYDCLVCLLDSNKGSEHLCPTKSTLNVERWYFVNFIKLLVHLSSSSLRS
jgi:hypothetical protein